MKEEGRMGFVKELADIIENIETVDKYLLDPVKQDFVIGLIKEGSCFVAVKGEAEYRFYPSRFIGYKNNNLEAQTKRDRENGKDSSPSISQIFKRKPHPSQDLELEYKKFCQKLGFTASDKGSAGVEHKYWTTSI
jgi:hypothetical protein